MENKTLRLPGDIMALKADIGPVYQIDSWQHCVIREALDLEAVPVFHIRL